jgi:hypothetical protein
MADTIDLLVSEFEKRVAKRAKKTTQTFIDDFAAVVAEHLPGQDRHALSVQFKALIDPRPHSKRTTQSFIRDFKSFIAEALLAKKTDDPEPHPTPTNLDEIIPDLDRTDDMQYLKENLEGLQLTDTTVTLVAVMGYDEDGEPIRETVFRHRFATPSPSKVRAMSSTVDSKLVWLALIERSDGWYVLTFVYDCDGTDTLLHRLPKESIAPIDSDEPQVPPFIRPDKDGHDLHIFIKGVDGYWGRNVDGWIDEDGRSTWMWFTQSESDDRPTGSITHCDRCSKLQCYMSNEFKAVLIGENSLDVDLDESIED